MFTVMWVAYMYEYMHSYCIVQCFLVCCDVNTRLVNNLFLIEFELLHTVTLTTYGNTFN